MHPAFVHFPIALFTLYGVLELVRFGNFSKQEWWFRLKGALVIFGTLAVYPTLLTGNIAKEAYGRGSSVRSLLEVHEKAGQLTAFIFTILAVAYIISFLRQTKWANNFILKLPVINLQSKTNPTRHLLLDTMFAPLLALLGLIAVTFTGALGGALVYGPTADPVVTFVYNLFF